MARRHWRKKKRKSLNYAKYSVKRLTGIISINEQKISALNSIRSANEGAKKRNDAATKRVGDEALPYLSKRMNAEKHLKELGFWKALFSSSEAETIKREIAALKEQEGQIWSRKPTPEKILEWRDAKRLKNDLERCYEKISAAQLCLPQAQQREAEATLKKQVEKSERQRLKAIADAYMGKARKMAETIRRQLKRYDHCPYCFGPLGDVPHADHIHPVSAGGLSVEANMIFVCSVCNGNKSDLTLREFCSRFGLQRDRVEAILIKLEKRV